MPWASRARPWVKRRLPVVVSAIHFLRRLPWRYLSVEERFARTARQHVEAGLESRSGPGSSLAETAAIREALPRLLRELEVATLLDIPCGDFHWMREVDLANVQYLGADILADQLERNAAVALAGERRSFIKLDIRLDPLPRADLVFCRDCLVHLSFADISLALENIKRSKATYLLTTTFPATAENQDIVTGEWRPLNLERPPFLFPEPLRLLNERCSIERFADKSLGLWRVDDLPPMQPGMHAAPGAR